MLLGVNKLGYLFVNFIYCIIYICQQCYIIKGVSFCVVLGSEAK